MNIKRSFDAVRTVSEALFFPDFIYSHEAIYAIYPINSYVPSSVKHPPTSNLGLELTDFGLEEHRVWFRVTTVKYMTKI